MNTIQTVKRKLSHLPRYQQDIMIRKNFLSCADDNVNEMADNFSHYLSHATVKPQAVGRETALEIIGKIAWLINDNKQR